MTISIDHLNKVKALREKCCLDERLTCSRIYLVLIYKIAGQVKQKKHKDMTVTDFT